MLEKSRPKHVRRIEGSIVKIPVAAGKVAYGLILKEPLVAVFDRQFDEKESLDLQVLLDTPIAFELMVMNYAITRGRWVVVGRVAVPDHFQTPPAFCKRDKISGKLTIYQELEEFAPHYERDATLDECRGLETAAVWDPEHVEDRLKDHFAGRPNVWTKQLRIWPSEAATRS